MSRTKTWFWLLAAFYAVSWFIPAAGQRGSNRIQGSPGYAAFYSALRLGGYYGEDQPILTWIGRLSALSNAWFVGSFLVLANLTRKPRPVVYWGLIASGVINLYWLYFSTMEPHVIPLAGYYIWLASYFVLAAMARRIAREPAQ